MWQHDSRAQEEQNEHSRQMAALLSVYWVGPLTQTGMATP